MFGRIFGHALRRGYKNRSMTKLAMMGFRTTPVLSAKLSIGEAVDVLEHKLSGISQVVSRYL